MSHLSPSSVSWFLIFAGIVTFITSECNEAAHTDVISQGESLSQEVRYLL